jgi:exopolyphosphatase/pppGpp-phosphohydrolase
MSEQQDSKTIDAVLALSQSCNDEREHMHRVAKLAIEMFDRLCGVHGLGPQDRLWLQYAALLHDIGWIEGRRGHHKTSLRLIMGNAGLPFEPRERTIVGLTARYHRKGLPKDGDPYFGDLGPDDQRRVRVLAGILRVADGLDHGHSGVIWNVLCRISSEELAFDCYAAGPADVEIAAAQEKADLLESVLGRRCVVRILAKPSVDPPRSRDHFEKDGI